MLRINRHFVWSVFLILVVIINLMNVNVVLADDSTPPPPATEEPTQPPVEPTETPVVETPAPTETPVNTETPVVEEQPPAEEEAPLTELLADVPENTDIVVLDENGNPVPLASQEALNIILDTDPMWCPAGVLPGGVGCTINFLSVTALLKNMRDFTNTYDEHGIIYFTVNPGSGTFSLTTAGTSLGVSDYNNLKNFNLTLQGGWNGSTVSPTFTAQTNFGSTPFTIGESGNPWVGNITLTNFTFSSVSSSNAVTVYTTSGNITLNNVDVAQQAGGNNTAFLDSNSGNVTVQNGSSFDGNNSGGNSNQNRGFSADTNTGAITITDTTFTDAKGCLNLFIGCVDLPTNYTGATLSAPTVTLTNVTANNNDETGIRINNANLVTLNNVTATNNGTITLPIRGGGIDIDGTGATIVNVTGGTFSNNTYYGIYMDGVFVGLNFVPDGTLNYLSPPTCSGNLLPLPAIDPNNCDNLVDPTPPVLTLPANIIVEATGASGSVVTYSAIANDAIDGPRPVNCVLASGSTFPITTTTVNCSSSDLAGNTASGSFTVTVQDTTPPLLTLPANMTLEATGSSGAVATFSASATDIVDGARTVTCVPASGSTFPITTTTVNCSASDTRGNTANDSFTVTVQDTTPPAIASMPNMIVSTQKNASKIVVYISPSTSDIVDGAGVATCVPPSGNYFPIGDTIVTCFATDNAGNTSSITFNIRVGFDKPLIVPQFEGNGIIPITGGELIDLNCFTVVNAFGVMVRFHHLCDQQAIINEVTEDTLPGALPSGYSFVQGLDIQVLEDGQILEALPNNAGVQADFPLPDSQGQFVVLYWNDGQWVEITQLMNDSDLEKMLSTDAQNEFYKMSSSNGSLQKILTTELTGTFVLVQK